MRKSKEALIAENRPSIDTLVGKKDLVGVEIGVWYGFHALNMLKRLDIKKLYLVDPYANYPCAEDNGNMAFSMGDEYKQNEIKSEAISLLTEYYDKIIWVEDYSFNCADIIPNDVDFVYIDGDHRYVCCRKDIELYFPKVKSGGLLAGHDYNKSMVKKAVTDFFGRGFFSSKGMDWWVEKK